MGNLLNQVHQLIGDSFTRICFIVKILCVVFKTRFIFVDNMMPMLWSDVKNDPIVICFCVATAFGKGVYFSKSFGYSAQPVYAVPDSNKNQHIFQCRVLTGLYHVGKPELMEPPVRDKSSLALYNSVVDNLKNPLIFVVFHDTQVYPEYLIVFQQWKSCTVGVISVVSVFHLYILLIVLLWIDYLISWHCLVDS